MWSTVVLQVSLSPLNIWERFGRSGLGEFGEVARTYGTSVGALEGVLLMLLRLCQLRPNTVKITIVATRRGS